MTEHKTFSDAEIREIEQRLSIRDFFSNDVKMGLCPYCHRQTFHYNRTNYLCANCDASGNGISYLICNEGMNFTEAVEHCQAIIKEVYDRPN